MPEVTIRIPPVFKAIDPIYIDDGVEISYDELLKIMHEDPEKGKKLLKKQKYDYYVIKGGRGSAKSESVGRKLLIKGMASPRKIVCGREFQSSIKESVYDMLADFISTYNLDTFYNVLKTEIRGVNGTTISFVGLRHSINSIKSMHDVDDFWGEEAQTFSANTLKILLPTIRKDGSSLYFTMNPDLEEDPAYQMLVANPPPKTLVLTVNYDQNPYFPERLRHLMEKDKNEDYERYLNIWEGKCRAAVEGAIFAKELQKATEERRITDVPYEKTKPVDLYFDLGRSDLTSIWFHQQISFESRLLRYYENGGEHFSHYIQYLKSLPYAYGTIYLPHDAENELLSSTKTIKQQALDAFPGVRIVVIPRIPQKALAIDSARGMMDTCYFDKTLCADGLSHLRKYHYKTDPETGKISREPEHDVHSNCADSFMAIGQARIPERKKLEKKNKSIYVGY